MKWHRIMVIRTLNHIKEGLLSMAFFATFGSFAFLLGLFVYKFDSLYEDILIKNEIFTWIDLSLGFIFNWVPTIFIGILAILIIAKALYDFLMKNPPKE